MALVHPATKALNVKKSKHFTDIFCIKFFSTVNVYYFLLCEERTKHTSLLYDVIAHPQIWGQVVMQSAWLIVDQLMIDDVIEEEWLIVVAWSEPKPGESNLMEPVRVLFSLLWNYAAYRTEWWVSWHHVYLLPPVSDCEEPVSTGWCFPVAWDKMVMISGMIIALGVVVRSM